MTFVYKINKAVCQRLYPLLNRGGNFFIQTSCQHYAVCRVRKKQRELLCVVIGFTFCILLAKTAENSIQIWCSNSSPKFLFQLLQELDWMHISKLYSVISRTFCMLLTIGTEAVNNPRSGVPHRMTLEEAKKILGVEQRFNSELIEQVPFISTCSSLTRSVQKTKHLINVNDPNKGGNSSYFSLEI